MKPSTGLSKEHARPAERRGDARRLAAEPPQRAGMGKERTNLGRSHRPATAAFDRLARRRLRLGESACVDQGMGKMGKDERLEIEARTTLAHGTKRRLERVHALLRRVRHGVCKAEVRERGDAAVE